MQKLWISLRMLFGWLFFWAFLDKVFGLGFNTSKANAWLAGNSPTYGFLSHSTGPFASIFQFIAGHPLTDWLFMLGLFCVGLALLFGSFVDLATYAGATMLFLMWLAVLPPKHNPIIDEHIIMAVTLVIMNRIPDVRSFSLWDVSLTDIIKPKK